MKSDVDAAADLTEDLAKRIREHRLSKKMSQQELAYRLGVSLRTISNWETGESLPVYKHSRAIDEFLAS